ncbi:hypothetical protein TUM17386_17730 [Shewanella algae]|nr:hypothetical protein TUM17386_17730 [Shewanella algae]
MLLRDLLMFFIQKCWQSYIRFCDRMGLTEENRRCCMPRLSDPPLQKGGQEAEAKDRQKEGEQHDL